MITGGTPTPSELRSKKYPFKLRRSPIAGYGGFATRRIRKGQRIIAKKGATDEVTDVLANVSGAFVGAVLVRRILAAPG